MVEWVHESGTSNGPEPCPSAYLLDGTSKGGVPMRGLELAERFFTTHGSLMIRDRFGLYESRIAAGLVGPGSECFGFDDEISRDHDWGPGFCLWLTEDDHALIGGELSRAYEHLPALFEGYGPRVTSNGEEWRVGVTTISAFYRRFTGIDRSPQSIREWLRIPEHALAACTNGKVFTDPLGDFTRLREALLSYYPESLRLKRIASRCLTVAQSGQYNYPRSLKRGDRFAALHARAQFCTDALSLAFLLNRRYAPFYKWMHRAVKDLPLLGRIIHENIEQVLMPQNGAVTSEAIESICGLLAAELRCQGLSDADGAFLLDHAHSVNARIRDPLLGGSLSIFP
jgi:hypothetical protein